MKTKFLEIFSLSEPGNIEDAVFDLGSDGWDLVELIPVFKNGDRQRNVTESGSQIARFVKRNDLRFIYLTIPNLEIPKLNGESIADALNEKAQIFEIAGFSCVSIMTRAQISGNPAHRFYGTDKIRMIFQKEIDGFQWNMYLKKTKRLIGSAELDVYLAEDGRRLSLKKQGAPSWLEPYADLYQAAYMESWKELIQVLINKEQGLEHFEDDLAQDIAVALGVREGANLEQVIFRLFALLEGLK